MLIYPIRVPRSAKSQAQNDFAEYLERHINKMVEESNENPVLLNYSQIASLLNIEDVERVRTALHPLEAGYNGLTVHKAVA